MANMSELQHTYWQMTNQTLLKEVIPSCDTIQKKLRELVRYGEALDQIVPRDDGTRWGDFIEQTADIYLTIGAYRTQGAGQQPGHRYRTVRDVPHGQEDGQREAMQNPRLLTILGALEHVKGTEYEGEALTTIQARLLNVTAQFRKHALAVEAGELLAIHGEKLKQSVEGLLAQQAVHLSGDSFRNLCYCHSNLCIRDDGTVEPEDFLTRILGKARVEDRQIHPDVSSAQQTIALARFLDATARGVGLEELYGQARSSQHMVLDALLNPTDNTSAALTISLQQGGRYTSGSGTLHELLLSAQTVASLAHDEQSRLAITNSSPARSGWKAGYN